MWYLKPDTLGLLLGLTALFALGGWLLRRFRPERSPAPLLSLGGLALLWLTAKRLAAFYLLYTLGSWVLTRLLGRVKRGKKLCFVLFCLLELLPFFYVRLAGPLGWFLPIAVLVGFSYNMLKAIDALYYVYYTGRELTLPAYGSFLLFFPTLTGGPILRYRDFVRSYEHPLPVTAEALGDCVRRFIRGLFKKLVLVSWLSSVLQWLLGRGEHFYVSLALAAVSYLLLYCDMSGYADMAIAAGTLTGIPVPENFKKPWTAASFTQFWRKWHVTLGDWIREHVFVVVAGKRLNRGLSALIALCTMLLMSLWHEFTWAAVIQGALLGAILGAENLLGLSTADRRRTKKWVYGLRCCLVTALFAVNSLFFTVDHGTLLRVLKGFLTP